MQNFFKICLLTATLSGCAYEGSVVVDDYHPVSRRDPFLYEDPYSPVVVDRNTSVVVEPYSPLLVDPYPVWWGGGRGYYHDRGFERGHDFGRGHFNGRRR